LAQALAWPVVAAQLAFGLLALPRLRELGWRPAKYLWQRDQRYTGTAT
jgi:hypothetical protein